MNSIPIRMQWTGSVPKALRIWMDMVKIMSLLSTEPIKEAQFLLQFLLIRAMVKRVMVTWKRMESNLKSKIMDLSPMWKKKRMETVTICARMWMSVSIIPFLIRHRCRSQRNEWQSPMRQKRMEIMMFIMRIWMTNPISPFLMRQRCRLQRNEWWNLYLFRDQQRTILRCLPLLGRNHQKMCRRILNSRSKMKRRHNLMKWVLKIALCGECGRNQWRWRCLLTHRLRLRRSKENRTSEMINATQILLEFALCWILPIPKPFLH